MILKIDYGVDGRWTDMSNENDSMQGWCKIEETGENTSVPIPFFSKRLYHTDCRVIFSKTHTKEMSWFRNRASVTENGD
jgi:hypothetical protein